MRAECVAVVLDCHALAAVLGEEGVGVVDGRDFVERRLVKVQLVAWQRGAVDAHDAAVLDGECIRRVGEQGLALLEVSEDVHVSVRQPDLGDAFVLDGVKGLLLFRRHKGAVDDAAQVRVGCCNAQDAGRDQARVGLAVDGQCHGSDVGREAAERGAADVELGRVRMLQFCGPLAGKGLGGKLV